MNVILLISLLSLIVGFAARTNRLGSDSSDAAVPTPSPTPYDSYESLLEQEVYTYAPASGLLALGLGLRWIYVMAYFLGGASRRKRAL